MVVEQRSDDGSVAFTLRARSVGTQAMMVSGLRFLSHWSVRPVRHEFSQENSSVQTGNLGVHIPVLVH